MGVSPSDLRELTGRIVDRAAPAYLMAVAGNADPMLGYLTTSFREHPRLRRRYRRRVTSVMHRRLDLLDVNEVEGRGEPTTTANLYALYAQAGGDHRTSASLADEGQRTLHGLRERGYDLGHGCGDDGEPPPAVQARLESIYRHARQALYATLAPHVIADASPRHVRARTRAADRDEYLAHPWSGSRLRDEDARAVAGCYPSRRPQVQIVVSDGLNANAVNGQLRVLLPPLRRLLQDAGCHVGETDVVVDNGRVRAGYHVGDLVDATTIVHIIGERPGTGLDTVSAYLTYGRDTVGQSRWATELDHSCTTAVCGIHPRGKPPAAAVDEIVRAVRSMIEQRRSGVALHPD
jgi:ethanolamine ammonia-lyase large subunit